MNLLLLEPDEVLEPGRARVTGRRFEHAREILGVQPGKRLRVGVLDGGVGTATVAALGEDTLELELDACDQAPPSPSPHTLAVALARPPTLRKVLQQTATMGIKHLIFFRANRTEKSYLQSHALRPEDIREQLWLGLEQARDTVLPRVEIADRFRPFVEDRLAELPPALVADPGGREQRAPVAEPRTLVVGPEGGFTDFERELFAAGGHATVGLGPRILRVETAVVALLARLSP